jgi:hypothetical protein
VLTLKSFDDLASRLRLRALRCFFADFIARTIDALRAVTAAEALIWGTRKRPHSRGVVIIARKSALAGNIGRPFSEGVEIEIADAEVGEAGIPELVILVVPGHREASAVSTWVECSGRPVETGLPELALLAVARYGLAFMFLRIAYLILERSPTKERVNLIRIAAQRGIA